jgi:AAA15 family ATPase/GTPase
MRKIRKFRGQAMLLEFRVRNYRSFSKEIVLSFAASNDKQLLETNTADTGVRGIPRTVRSAVVYGANASGKSNLIRAMQLMRGVVLESALLRPDQTYNVQPFRLGEELRNEPTLFEVTVLLDGVRHQYGFEFTANRIIAEWLLVYKTSKPQQWIDRKPDPKSGEEKFEFSSHLAGQKRTWQEATRPNALFFSTAVQLNSEQLRPLYNWFAESLIVLMDGGHIPFDFTTGMVRTSDGESAVKSMMASADIAISAIRAVPRKGFMQQFTFDMATGGTQEAKREEREFLVPEFTHKSGKVSANFGYEDESQGTQKLFSLAGPLLDIIKNGKILMIDELDRSLHPLLVRQIVETFQDPTLNERGAQLFFSTHDTSLLDHELLRRDQIWLTEKRRDQSSDLIPLMEFSPRKNEALERGYLSGRYGGVPVLNRTLLSRSVHGK